MDCDGLCMYSSFLCPLLDNMRDMMRNSVEDSCKARVLNLQCGGSQHLNRDVGQHLCQQLWCKATLLHPKIQPIREEAVGDDQGQVKKKQEAHVNYGRVECQTKEGERISNIGYRGVSQRFCLNVECANCVDPTHEPHDKKRLQNQVYRPAVAHGAVQKPGNSGAQRGVTTSVGLHVAATGICDQTAFKEAYKIQHMTIPTSIAAPPESHDKYSVCVCSFGDFH